MRDYDCRTAQPGAAMTVKKMGPASGACSPAFFMFVRRKIALQKGLAECRQPKTA
jgi:hypothetical protein